MFYISDIKGRSRIGLLLANKYALEKDLRLYLFKRMRVVVSDRIQIFHLAPELSCTLRP
jgi:hypothetical protein